MQPREIWRLGRCDASDARPLAPAHSIICRRITDGSAHILRMSLWGAPELLVDTLDRPQTPLTSDPQRRKIEPGIPRNLM